MSKNWSEKLMKIALAAAVMSAGVLLISNLAATKLWDFCGIAVDGGIIVFPISYIIGDVIMEIFGKKVADYIVWLSFGLCIFGAVIFLLVEILPPFPDWGGQEAYQQILGFTPRVILGSLAAYVSSGLLNNLVFEKIKKKTGEQKLFVRALGSSVVAKIVDTAVFEIVAFLGVLSFTDFLAQAGFAYVASIFLEILLTPLTYLCVKMIKGRLAEK